MEALGRATTALFSFPSVSVSGVSSSRRRRTPHGVSFSRKRREFKVFAEKEEPKLDERDLMDIKFGRLLGEDPKLTLAKILGKKVNPDASYLEIEKSFYKNKGKIVEVKELPFDVPNNRKSSGSSAGLELVRPVPRKGVKFESGDKQISAETRKPSTSIAKDINKGMVPNVILRKPKLFSEEDVEDRQSSFKIKPNLLLNMKSQSMEDKFSDMTLLRKPEAVILDRKPEVGEDRIRFETGKEVGDQTIEDFTLIRKPHFASFETKAGSREENLKDVKMDEKLLQSEDDKSVSVNAKESYEESSKEQNAVILEKLSAEMQSTNGMHCLGESHMPSGEQDNATEELSSSDLGNSYADFMKAELQGKPKRLDHRLEGGSNSSSLEVLPNNGDNPSASLLEDTDWTRAEDLVRTGDRVKVELISASTRGFAVSFGCLFGFLPYRNLAAKRKFLAFESWLRQKGIDPSTYRQNLGVIGSYETLKRTSLKDAQLASKKNQIFEGEISPDMKLGDLLQIYDAEKLKFLSSFVGQKIDVFVLTANKKARKLIFSLIREKEELLEKKRALMTKLRVGDIVECSIKKITYFGIFVEVEGIPALVHQSEVSWDATLEPLSSFKIGQVVKAKVQQLDFALERIFLSLKEITVYGGKADFDPDPLAEALDSLVGDENDLDGRLQVAEADTEWAEVELLVKELEKIDGVESVSKGRYFLSPGLTPTFQVYMASIFENQYKLLARSGNRVQEVIVQSSLDKEEMKSTILSCTNRVE